VLNFAKEYWYSLLSDNVTYIPAFMKTGEFTDLHKKAVRCSTVPRSLVRGHD